MKIIVNEIKEIEKIVEHVHDRFFWLEKVLFQEADKILKIPTSVLSDETIVKKRWILSKRKVEIIYAELLIHNVHDYKIVDDAGIGVGDIDQIFLKNELILCIKCGLPIYIDINISGIFLELNISDQVLESVEYVIYPFSVSRLNPKEFSQKEK